MQIPSSAVGASTFAVDAPAVIYQTRLTAGKQDSATPEKLVMQLSDAAAAALRACKNVSAAMYGAIRRFDMVEVEAFDDATGKMLGLRLPQKTFVFDFHPASNTVSIHIHRKELPVSRSFGDCRFVFVFLVVPVNEVVVTKEFAIVSKQPKAVAAPKASKRARGPPPRRPAPAPATSLETRVNAMLSSVCSAKPVAPVSVAVSDDDVQHCSAAKRVRVRAPSPDPCPSPVPSVVQAVRPASPHVALTASPDAKPAVSVSCPPFAGAGLPPLSTIAVGDDLFSDVDFVPTPLGVPSFDLDVMPHLSPDALVALFS